VSLTEYFCIWQHLLFLQNCLLRSEVELYLLELLLTGPFWKLTSSYGSVLALVMGV